MSDSATARPALVTVAFLAVTVVFTALSTLAVGLRLYASFVLRNQRTLITEEYLILVALVFCYGALVQTGYAAAHGGIGTTHLSTLDSAIFYIKIMWIDPFLVGPASMFVKLSVLAFYLRIFAPIRWFRYACYLQMFLVTGWCLSWLFGQIFSFHPIDKAWDPRGDYEAINYSAFTLGIFGSCLALDCITLCLPLFVIGTLRMPTHWRWKAASTFMLGIFCVVAAAVRLYYAYKEIHLAQHATTAQNHYQVVTTTAMWSRIEPNASIVAACLPLYAPLLVKARQMDSAIRSAVARISLRSHDSLNSARKAASSLNEIELSSRRTSEPEHVAHEISPVPDSHTGRDNSSAV